MRGMVAMSTNRFQISLPKEKVCFRKVDCRSYKLIFIYISVLELILSLASCTYFSTMLVGI